MTIFNYTVNYFDIGIVVLIIIAAVAGWKRGAAISVVNLVRSAAGFFLCFYLSSALARPIYENYARPRCLELINNEIANSNNIDSTINNLNGYIKSLPDFISQRLDIKTIDISSAKIAESILDNVFEPFITALIKIAVFVIVFILFFVSTGIIISVIRRHIRRKNERRRGLSPLSTANKAFGLLFGVTKAFVIIFAVSAVLMYFTGLDENAVKTSAVLKEADSSALLKYFSVINPFGSLT